MAVKGELGWEVVVMEGCGVVVMGVQGWEVVVMEEGQVAAKRTPAKHRTH